MRSLVIALLMCALEGMAQDLPPAPDVYHPNEIKGVQPDDLVAPAVIMTFGMLIAGNFMTSTSWNQNELAAPVLIFCGTVAAVTIPLNVGARKKDAKRKQGLSLAQ